MTTENSDDNMTYKVVVNHEEQYSICIYAIRQGLIASKILEKRKILANLCPHERF